MNDWYWPGLPASPPPMTVAVVDSGVASGHPHITNLVQGCALVGEDPSDTRDRLGHGTAVAAAILEWAPWVGLMPIRVMDAALTTSARRLAEGIVWASEHGARLINVSLGTVNPAHEPVFEAALDVVAANGALVVSAARADMGSAAPIWYPGSLQRVLGVLPLAGCPRGALGLHDALVACSPFPRPIPGVPVERNLSGVSFAVANATGLLARLLAGAFAPPSREMILGAIEGGRR